MKAILAGFSISAPLGLLVGLGMCYAAWQHNPQCEFHCEGSINGLALFTLWASWFITITLIAGVVISLLWYLVSRCLSGN
ncbi:hypothetical protein [Shewanella sp. NIFS-20-20]|uniref:hypothetical protein n=1 Tax=Shewanella sp. NIFS-20-20 TaxID=2853806 RepID=UPI001C468587|nr:hypothetical protein [Shewanella sp. NIFS-20-20]MBV7315743.1 hypothetical protein [Shewanella sp. NIFS-20-20]